MSEDTWTPEQGRLAASAPILLAALQKIERGREVRNVDYGHTEFVDWAPGEAAEIARAAIAQALDHDALAAPRGGKE